MKYRGRTEITSQILEAANEGIPKTKIMYKAFLSYGQLKEYLTVLTANNLLEYIPLESKYRTTEKGREYLKASQAMSSIAGEMRQLTT
jgi:predicted transcriptional regulator